MVQNAFYGLPVNATLLEVHASLRKRYPCTVDDTDSLGPLEMLIFAILSQRTRHAPAQRAYSNLRLKFPNWTAVCDAPIPMVKSAISQTTWPELKVKRVQDALTHIRNWQSGQLNLDNLFLMTDLDALVWLERLPGVGRKTSACVLLFSTLRRPVLPVDTGHRRFMMRLGLLRPSAGWDSAHWELQAQLPRDWRPQDIEIHHTIVKRHEQTYCTVKEPICDQCPLQDLCPYGQARLNQKRHDKPLKMARRTSSNQTNPWQICMFLDECHNGRS